MEYIIKNYISKTPFLQYHHWGDFIDQADLGFDLIIAEVTKETKNNINSLLSQFDNKHFIFLEDIKDIDTFAQCNKKITLQKNITYFDFIDALSSFADDEKLENTTNYYN